MIREQFRRGNARFGFLGPLAIEGGAAAVALDVHFKDRRVVDEAVDGRQRHGRIGEDLAPFAERLVGCDQH